MMVFDLFFRVGPAVKVIFEIGYEPKEELFYELTSAQYEQLEREGEDISKTWYTIIPESPKDDSPSLLIVEADEKEALLDGAQYINDLCNKSESENSFSTFHEKLKYAASKMPAVFSESSKYVKNKKGSHLKIVKKEG